MSLSTQNICKLNSCGLALLCEQKSLLGAWLSPKFVKGKLQKKKKSIHNWNVWCLYVTHMQSYHSFKLRMYLEPSHSMGISNCAYTVQQHCGFTSFTIYCRALTVLSENLGLPGFQLAHISFCKCHY